MRKSNGQDFSTLIKEASKTANFIKEHSSDFLKNLPNSKNGNFYGDDFRSFFSTDFTLENMIKFYDFILMKKRESCCVSTDKSVSTDNNVTYCLKCPNVYDIDGDYVCPVGLHFSITDRPIQNIIDRHFKDY